MSHAPSDDESPTEPRPPLVPHLVVAVLLGVVFAVSTLLAAALPAIAVAYVVVGFAVRDIVLVLVLWALSATVTVLSFAVISRTYARAVLRRPIATILPDTALAED